MGWRIFIRQSYVHSVEEMHLLFIYLLLTSKTPEAVRFTVTFSFAFVVGQGQGRALGEYGISRIGRRALIYAAPVCL